MSGTLAVQDWQRFAAPRFRTYHYLAMTQGVVAVLAGFDVIIPFALAVGTPPFIAVLLGVLPLAGGMAQLLVPRLLDRTEGNLRGLTIFVAALAEPRGLYLALLAIGAATGLISGPLLLVLLAIVVGLGSVLGSIATANLLSWHSAVLTDEERRLTVPRLMAVSLGVGALLLLPMAFLLDAMVGAVGIYAYMVPFLVGGALRRGRDLRSAPPAPSRACDRAATAGPGRRRADARARQLPELQQRQCAGHGRRSGHVRVHHLGRWPECRLLDARRFDRDADHGRRRGLLRGQAGPRLVVAHAAQLVRDPCAAMFSPLLALPGHAFAPLFLIASAMLGAIGFASGSLAANERLFRLISGPAGDSPPRALPCAHIGCHDRRPVGGAAVIAGAVRSATRRTRRCMRHRRPCASSLSARPRTVRSPTAGAPP